jgi:putative IMPACT (imprinted ancient) family translation regulator
VAIVIRYFGGIKLGAGGLVRAYSNSILETLKLTNIIKLTSGILIEVKFKYEQTKLVDYIFKDKIILEKKYDDLITYILTLKESDSNIIDELKNNNIIVTIKNKVLIEED